MLDTFYISLIALHFVLIGIVLKLLGQAAISYMSEYAQTHQKIGFKNVPPTKPILLVTAHPDDEAMFFIPTIKSLQKAGYRIHLLCLSTGDADGLGKERTQELITCCTQYLNMSRSSVSVLHDPKFPDGMNKNWSAAAVANQVNEYVKRHDVGAVITFDQFGISGHRNHISVHFGVQEWIIQQQKESRSSNIPAYQLLTTSRLRKFLGSIDFLLNTRHEIDQVDHVFVQQDGTLVYNALSAHKTQFVWFRRLFIQFSRYTYMNTLSKISSN